MLHSVQHIRRCQPLTGAVVHLLPAANDPAGEGAIIHGLCPEHPVSRYPPLQVYSRQTDHQTHRSSICSAIKTSYLPQLADRVDITWTTFYIFVWTTSELFVIIFCGTIPTLKSVLDFFLRGAKSTRADDSAGSWSKNGAWGSSSSRRNHSRRSVDVEEDTTGILLHTPGRVCEDYSAPDSLRSALSGRS